MAQQETPTQAYAMALALDEQKRMPVYLKVQANAGHDAATAVDVLTFIAKICEIEKLRPLGSSTS